MEDTTSSLPPTFSPSSFGSDRLNSTLTNSDELHIRLALELGGVGSFEWNLVTGEGAASKGCYEIFGYGSSITPTYSNVLKVVLPEDLGAFRTEIDTALRDERQFRSEFRIVRSRDGAVRWVRVDGGIIADEEGRAARMVGIVRDVTDRRRAQERENLLAREVDHRAKNLLTVVQSLVQLTRADDIDAFRQAVNGRIQALGRAHSLLASSRWEGADLCLLIEEELAPFTGLSQQLKVEGPPVKLRPAAAQSMALVLHELITNAVKYGALSNESGQVDLHWWHEFGEHKRLHIRWCEQGGPTIRPPDRKGFGTTVISASVERQLGGTLRYDWRPDGLCCDMSLPGKELADKEGQFAVSRAPHQSQVDAQGGGPLAVLVVEDEPLIALQIAQLLADAGCRVIGPAATVSEALDLIGGANFDVALLDVDLNGARSFPIADLLGEESKPFGFLSGFGVSELPARFQHAILLSKPLCAKELQMFVAQAASGGAELTAEGTSALQKRLL